MQLPSLWLQELQLFSFAGELPSPCRGTPLVSALQCTGGMLDDRRIVYVLRTAHEPFAYCVGLASDMRDRLPLTRWPGHPAVALPKQPRSADSILQRR